MKMALKKDIIIFIFLSTVISLVLSYVFSHFEEKTVVASQLVQMGHFEKIKDLKIEKNFTESESDLVESLQRKSFLTDERKSNFESLQKSDPLIKIYAKNLYNGKVEFFISNKTGQNLNEISNAIVDYVKERHLKQQSFIFKGLKEGEKKGLTYKDSEIIGPIHFTNRTNRPHISLIIIAGILAALNFIFIFRSFR